MQSRYEPIPLDVRQSRYGYWIATISVAPGLNLSVMVCKLGISPDEAMLSGLASLLGMTGEVPLRWQTPETLRPCARTGAPSGAETLTTM